MILVDANYILRALTRPATSGDEAKARIAQTFFREAARGERDFIVSEAILAEVFFVMNSSRHYALSAPEVVDRLKPILELPSCKMPGKRLYLRALDIAGSFPTLGFVDALTVATSEQPGIELATFDSDFDRFATIMRFKP